jgi:sugar phosphate permease
MTSNQEDNPSSHAVQQVPSQASDSSIPGSATFTRWHLLTISLLVLGYSGYYFCRSDLSVVLPLLIRDLGQHGVPANVAQIHLGFIASAGVLAYALGKFVSGSMLEMPRPARSWL